MKTNDHHFNPVSCIIIDDESKSADILENLLGKNPRIHVIQKLNDPKEALKSILLNKPDLLFLDIQMPGMSGFELLEALNRTDVKPFIIFVTGFDEFAVQAIRASAFDYLLKPVDEVELAQSVQRFLMHFDQSRTEVNYAALLEKTTKKKIRFNTTGGFVLFNPEDIVFIQADWNYSEIHLGKERHEVVTMNLGSVEEMLPPGAFARINRSVIINLAYLEKVYRGKRMCMLKKDNITYEFKIPLLRIRYLEDLL